MFVDAVWRNGFDGPPPDKVGRDFQGNTWVTLTSPEVERFYNEQTDRKKQEVEKHLRAEVESHKYSEDKSSFDMLDINMEHQLSILFDCEQEPGWAKKMKVDIYNERVRERNAEARAKKETRARDAEDRLAEARDESAKALAQFEREVEYCLWLDWREIVVIRIQHV